MKINETKHARRELLDTAKVHLEAGDMDKYNEVMEQVADLNVQIEGMLQFDAEAGKFDDGDQEMEDAPLLHPYNVKKKQKIALLTRFAALTST